MVFGRVQGVFRKRERWFFSKCLVLVHLTRLGGVPSQILTLPNYHTPLPEEEEKLDHVLWGCGVYLAA